MRIIEELIRVIGGKLTNNERCRFSRWIGYEAASAHKGHKQTFAAGSQPADDL